MELRRKISRQIEDWYRRGEKKALLIKGARQVGKTHVIRSTLDTMKCCYVEFNLIETPAAVSVLQNAQTINDMILGLSTLTDKPLVRGQTVLFFDEIQRYREMVTRIKFLAEDGSFRYILSGSLLGIEITNLESAPVGYMTSYEMFPLDFEEYLQITNITEDVIAYIKHCFEKRIPIMETIHEKLLILFDQYLVTGGMPEAVSRFASSYNVNEVMEIHRNIADLYKLDFTQYEADDKRLILSDIYDLVPAELLKQNRLFIISDIRKGLHYERISSSFLWLIKAGVVLPVYNVTEPRIPLRLNEKHSLFKLYLLDIGMLTSLYGMSTKTMILNRDKNLNGGGIYENAIASELVYKGFSIYYYNSNRLGELDFVIEYNGRATPIEVKSGKDYKIHSALSACMGNAEYAVDEAFVFAGCNVEKSGKTTYLPVYMAAFIENMPQEDVIAERVLF